MSNSYNYNPIPPRVWSRVQDRCTFVDSSNNAYYQSVFIPLPAIPFTQQPITLAEADYQNRLLYKGNILQYKGNSSRLTKKQHYTQLAKGMGPSRTKVFATQTQTYTNPNTTGLQRVNFTTYPFPNTLVGKPNNISGPFQYGVPNPNGCLNPDGTPSTSLQDGGTLVCGTLANPCSNELIKANNGSAAICNPASASDVPGTSFLCWNRQVQTWFPRQRYVMPNSDTKWPEGYKGFVSAVAPEAPILTLDSFTNTTASISWVDASGVCLAISSYRIYLNDQFYTTVPYPIRSYTLYNLSGCSNNIYVTSVVSGTESVGSNVVTSCRTPDAPSNVTGYFVSSSSALLNWTAPPVTASTCIATSYNVYYGTDNITFTKINVGNVLTSTITGLTTTPYYVYVTAQNNCGEGPASSHALVLPNPAPPQNLQPYTGQWQYFTVSWQSPAYSGSSPFSHYTLLIQNNLSPYTVFYQSTNYPTNNFDSTTVTPMVVGLFDVYVTAVNTDGYASTVVQCQVFSTNP